MGSLQTKSRTLTDSDIKLLSQQVQLEPYIIQQLYEAFMERAGRDGRMTISDFKKTYTEIDPNANFFTLDNDAERIFLMFDRDHNGVLTFDEFTMAYILLQRGVGVAHNRWQIVMNSMPDGVLSRSGFLNFTEALRLLQYIHQFYQIPNFDPVVQHNLLWNQLTPQMDLNGYIAQEEYLRLLSAQPHIQPHMW